MNMNYTYTAASNTYSIEASTLSSLLRGNRVQTCPHCGERIVATDLIERMVQKDGDGSEEVMGWKFKCKSCAVKINVFNT